MTIQMEFFVINTKTGTQKVIQFTAKKIINKIKTPNHQSHKNSQNNRNTCPRIVQNMKEKNQFTRMSTDLFFPKPAIDYYSEMLEKETNFI